MARKSDKSKSLVPVATKHAARARERSDRRRRRGHPDLTAAYQRVGASGREAARGGRHRMRDEDTVLALGRDYMMPDRTLPAAEVYVVDGAKPTSEDPWLGEADKLSWRDEVSGFDFRLPWA